MAISCGSPVRFVNLQCIVGGTISLPITHDIQSADATARASQGFYHSTRRGTSPHLEQHLHLADLASVRPLPLGICVQKVRIINKREKKFAIVQKPVPRIGRPPHCTAKQWWGKKIITTKKIHHSPKTTIRNNN